MSLILMELHGGQLNLGHYEAHLGTEILLAQKLRQDKGKATIPVLGRIDEIVGKK